MSNSISSSESKSISLSPPSIYCSKSKSSDWVSLSSWFASSINCPKSKSSLSKSEASFVSSIFSMRCLKYELISWEIPVEADSVPRFSIILAASPLNASILSNVFSSKTCPISDDILDAISKGDVMATILLTDAILAAPFKVWITLIKLSVAWVSPLSWAFAMKLLTSSKWPLTSCWRISKKTGSIDKSSSVSSDSLSDGRSDSPSSDVCSTSSTSDSSTLSK